MCLTLGLDLATLTGWALARSGAIVASGVWDLTYGSDQHYGHMFDQLYQKLAQTTEPGTQMVYEMAHHRAGPATRIGVGLNAVVLLYAARCGLPCPRAVHSATLKLRTVGSGRAPKSQIMTWAADRLSRQPLDDNEADAVALALMKFDT